MFGVRKRTISGLVGALLCLPALAQQAQPTQVAQAAPQAEVSDEHLEQIVVTGSLIPRTNAETAEAVTVVSADTLKDMGITTVEQALQQISSLQSGAYQTGSSVSTFTGGGSYASMRGLGPSKTLVLIDGQRLANNVVAGNAVDINGIPFAAIERVEVLREGASSLYGTDAIGGVINFITKKDYDGGEANLEYTKPQHPGGGGDNLDFTYGKGSLTTDGYNFLVAANYTHNNELSATQRSFSATGWNPAKGLTNQNGPEGPFPGSYTDAKGNSFQVNYATCPGNPYAVKFDGYCAYEYSAAVDLIPKNSDLSGLVSFNKSLPANNTLAVQYFYTLSKSLPWSGPEEYAGLTMNTNSPYFPTAAESTCFGNTCPATPDLTSPISVGWTDPTNNRYFLNQNTEQRLLLDLTGQNFGWDYYVAGDYSKNHNIQDAAGGYPDIAMWAPNGVLSNLINPFGPYSAAGQALINSSYMNGVLETGTLTLKSFNGHANHKVAEIPGAGRPIVGAVGFDIREENIVYEPTALATTLYSATFFPPTSITGNRNEKAIYGELNVPVTKQFEFTVSDREDKYSDFGSTNNAKLSLRYQPHEMITFRGAASTGFRAPSLVDLYSPQVLGATAGSIGANNPNCLSGNYTVVFSALNCPSQGMAVYGGNPKLQPEKSDNYDLGIVIEPIKDLGITVDYYKITVRNEIQTIPDTAIYGNPSAFASDYVLNNAGTLTEAPSAPTACVNGPSTPTCGYIYLTTQNTGGIRTSGLDLSVSYLQRTSIGKFSFGLDGTYVTNFQLQEYTGAPWITLDRQFNQGNQPVIGWQHLFTVDWTQGAWGAGLSNKYISSYTDEFLDANGNQLTVSAYSIWNGYVSWKPIKPLKVLVGIRNLFDTSPSFSNQTQNWQAGYNPLFSDPTGRAFYTKLTYVF